MATAVVYGPDGKVIAEHERDTEHRAWLSAVGVGSYEKPVRRKGLVRFQRYEVGTVIEIGTVRKRWDGAAWQEVAGTVA